jgi:uncharacterized membrane protein
MISSNLRGYDIHPEFQTFSDVLRTGRWEPQFSNFYSSVISISILPTIMAVVPGLEGVSVLSLLFPAVYSVLPVFLYKVYRKILTPRSSFLSVFLFMSFFYDEMPQVARQEVAEVLLVVLLLIFLSPKMRETSSGTLAAIILTVGLVAAHYSLAYLYVFLVISGWVVAAIFRRRDLSMCSSMMLLMTVVICFAWYAFSAGGVAVAGLAHDFSVITRGMIEDFFATSARPPEVNLALGLTGMPGILHDLNRGILYLVQLCLVLGFFALLSKRQKSETERRLLPVMAVGFAFIGSAVVLPFFYATLELSRIYHLSLLLMSPCFVYGTRLLGSLLGLLGSFTGGLRNVWIRAFSFAKWVPVAAIVFSCFLFTSGWVWAVSMDRPTSLVFDSERLLKSSDVRLNAIYFGSYTIDADIAGARWLGTHYLNTRPVCGDTISNHHVLTSYGEFPQEEQVLPWCNISRSYVFVSEFNNLRGVGQADHRPPDNIFPMSEISGKLVEKNRIYSDGGAVIYE